MSGPFKMKGSPMQRNFGIGASPMREGKTSRWDKIKAFGKAVYQNVGKVHGHGGDDTLSHNTYRTYKKLKKDYRSKAARDNATK